MMSLPACVLAAVVRVCVRPALAAWKWEVVLEGACC